MNISYGWIKDSEGALDRAIVADLARHFELSTFIETGTYLGDTLAAMEGTFDRRLSIELAPQFAQAARERFAHDRTVEVIEADSASGLASAFARSPHDRALIWLDAHYSGGPTAKGDGNTPVMAEIDQILRDRDGRDVVLIDDVRLFWPVPGGFETHDSLEGYPSLADVAARLSQAGFDVFLLCDALLAAPRGLTPSPVLSACTRSRLRPADGRVDETIEAVLLGAEGAERRALTAAPLPIESQKAYGVGGHYFYWRGVLRQSEGDLAGASEDLSFAARCGVIPASRATVVRAS